MERRSREMLLALVLLSCLVSLANSVLHVLFIITLYGIWLHDKNIGVS